MPIVKFGNTNKLARLMEANDFLIEVHYIISNIFNALAYQVALPYLPNLPYLCEYCKNL